MTFRESKRARKTRNRATSGFAKSSKIIIYASAATGRTLGEDRRGAVFRWVKFNAVGAIGIGVQFAVLLTMKGQFHLGYLAATAIAVEAAVIHNFVWHERYTWANRVNPSWRSSLPRLLRFNLTTGTVSIAGNLALTGLMVGRGHINYLIANGIAIVLCSLANFLVSEGWVFRTKGKGDFRRLAPRLE